MNDPESPASPAHVGDRQATNDEAFLDEAFDALSTDAATGQQPDPAPWLEQRPDLADEIAAVVELAAEVCLSTADPITPPTVPGYEIVRELGQGGMGAVYLARQAALANRLVALKVMPRGAALSPQARLRFHNEAAALARIRHPNVVAIYEVVDLGPTPAYAMEWIDGCTLFELVTGWTNAGSQSSSTAFSNRLGNEVTERLAVDAVARWGAQLAGALAAAHAEGLLHRDVKPTNVMLRRDGTALLTDFGLVRDEDAAMMTRSGAFLGTPAYAPPEQLAGHGVDERSDVYSLGATLYHALTGEAPFGRRQQHAILRAIEHGDLVALRQKNPNVPRDLATVVETAMDPSPSRRYATATELGKDLERYRNGQPVTARPAGPLMRLGKYARRNRATFYGALLGGVIAIAIAVMVAVWVVQQSRIPRRVAEHVRAARLALLDPKFDERIAYLMRSGGRAAPAQDTTDTRLTTALRQLDAALALRDDPEIRAERETVALANQLLAGAPPSNALAALAPDVLACTRTWSTTRELTHDRAKIERMSIRDRRCLGLLAVLCAADPLCIEAWRGLDLATGSDPLIDAALGQVYRQRGRPALAWPRLESAFAHFREATFLPGAIAEVALACGDPAYALRMMEHHQAPSTSHYDTQTRVHADALFALGQMAAARKLYLRHATRGNVPPTSHESLARFFAAEGNLERARHHHWRLALRWPSPERTQRLAATLSAQWLALSAPERTAMVTASQSQPGTFLDQLEYARSQNALDPHPELGELVTRLELTWQRLASWRREITPTHQLPPRKFEGSFQRLSAAPDGITLGTIRGAPTLAANGRLLAFAATTSLDSGASWPGPSEVFVRDLTTATTRPVTLPPNGQPTEGSSERPHLSKDGRWLVFYSQASHLAAGDINGDWDCFLYDTATGATVCVSVDERGQPQGLGSRTDKGRPTIGPDDRYIAFAAGPHRRAGEVRVFDRQADRVTWSTPAYGDGMVRPNAIVTTGRLLASSNSQITPDDRNDWMMDVFDYSIGTDNVHRISEREGASADAACLLASATPDGRWLLLSTMASNLVTIDQPSQWNLLLVDGSTRRMTRINATPAGGLHLGHGAATTGQRTVFAAAADPGDRVGPIQIWLYDHGSRKLAIVSRDATGGLANGDCSWPQLSGDGGFVVFVTTASNLTPTAANDSPQIVGRRIAQ